MKKLLFILGILFSAIGMKAQCSHNYTAPSSVDVTLDVNGQFLLTPEYIITGDFTDCTLEVGLKDLGTGQFLIPLDQEILLDCSHVGTHRVNVRIIGVTASDVNLNITINPGISSCVVNVPPDTYTMNFTKRNFGGALSTDATLNGNLITQYYDNLWFLPEADISIGENTIDFPSTSAQQSLSGISTLDVVTAQRMFVFPVEYPLQAVLMDVDDSGYLGVNDIVLLRQYILGINTTLPAQNYLFVSKTYDFPVDFDAFDFTDLNFREYKFDGSSVTAEDLNFFVYGLGDINMIEDSLTTNIISKRSNEELVIENKDVTAGETIMVPLSISTDDFKVNGLQFSLQLEGLNLSNIDHNYSATQFGYNQVSDEDLRFVFNDFDGLDEVEIVLELEVLQDGSLASMIAFNEILSPLVASYDEHSAVDLVFRTTSSTQEIFELSTTVLSSQILIDLPLNHKNVINLYSLEGRLVNQYLANNNQVVIDRAELTSSGMYFIATQIGDKVVTKKIIAL